jgi:hypothetical protein
LPTRRGQEDDCHFKYSPEEDMKGLIDFWDLNEEGRGISLHPRCEGCQVIWRGIRSTRRL